jgi:hypothetical protein
MSKNFKLKLPILELCGKKYTLGLGGIHSNDKGQQSIYRSNEYYILLDADVTSFYPMSIILNSICPAHLSIEAFKETIEGALDDRKGYKKKKKESVVFAALEYGLKIALNAIFGLFAYANFLLLDLLATYQTTVNNQLFILQLIEELNLNEIEVVSANTDGVLLYFKRDDLELVENICKQWETNTGFSLEYTEYDLYIRSDVNNYLARKTDGTIKIKGKFIPPGARLYPYYKYDMPFDNGFYNPIGGIRKGYSKPPVVAIALHKYYLEGILPEDFIPEHKDIYDFCVSQKVGSQFRNILEYVSRKTITNKPSKLKKVLLKEREVIPALYEEVVTYKTLKSGEIKVTTKNKKIRDKEIVPAKYDYVEELGELYASPKIEDKIIHETVVQQTVRFFVSNPEMDDNFNFVGYSLKKEKFVDLESKSKEKQKEIQQEVFSWLLMLFSLEYDFIKKYTLNIFSKFNLQRVDYCAKQFITLFMNYYSVKDFEEYNINYDYYISSTYKIIDEIEKFNFSGI